MTSKVMKEALKVASIVPTAQLNVPKPVAAR